MRSLLKLALAAGSVGVALVLVEFVLLRGVLGYHGIENPNVYAHDDLLGWALLPNMEARSSNLDFAFTVHTNGLGLRTGGREIDQASAAKRILLVGDSFAFGWGVGDEEVLSSRLEDDLAARGIRTAVLNAGVPGYSTDQDYLAWERLDPTVDPAVVILLMGNNDPPADNASTALMGDAIYSKPRFVITQGDGLELRGTPVPDKRQIIAPTKLEPLKRHARTLAAYALARHFLDARRAAASASAPAAEPAPVDLAVTGAIISAFNRRVREKGASLLVALIPAPSISAGVAAICREAGIPFLDLAPAFDGHDDFRLKYDGHWNARGHQAAADAITKVVETMIK